MAATCKTTHAWLHGFVIPASGKLLHFRPFLPRINWPLQDSNKGKSNPNPRVSSWIWSWCWSVPFRYMYSLSNSHCKAAAEMLPAALNPAEVAVEHHLWHQAKNYWATQWWGNATNPLLKIVTNCSPKSFSARLGTSSKWRRWWNEPTCIHSSLLQHWTLLVLVGTRRVQT